MGKSKLPIKNRWLEKFEKNNPTIVLNILYNNEKEILSAYTSKHNSTREKRNNSLNDYKWRRRRMTLSYSKKIICIITYKNIESWRWFLLPKLSCFRTENKFHSHEKIYKNKDFCEIVIPSEKNKVSKFNHYMKSDKMPYIIYADLECLVKK